MIVSVLTLTLVPCVMCVYNINVIGLLPFEGAWNGGKAIQLGIELALEQINERADILPGYRINFLMNDTKCDPGLGLNAMFHNFYTPPTKVIIVGAICSPVTEATAMVSYRWNVVQISPGSVSSALSDKTIYKKFLRTNSPENDVNPARIALLKAFGWSKIATVYQPYQLFSVSNDNLLGLLKQNGMTILTSEIIGQDPAIQLQKLKNRGARIIFGHFYEDMAVKIFCEAYKIGLYGPRIVWILIGWYKEVWWRVRFPSVTCSPEQMDEAVEGFFTVGRTLLNPKSHVTLSGYTPQELQRMYQSRMVTSLPYAELGLIGYDAMWTVAVALNKTISDLKTKGLKKIEDFTYDDEEIGNILFENAMKSDFYSSKGRIRFNEYGDLTSSFRIRHYQNGENRVVGFFYPRNEAEKQMEWIKETPIIWKSGHVPADAITKIEVTERLSKDLYICMCCLSCLGILLICVFLVFNIVYRTSRIVKMSSPNLNNVTLVGCLLLYTSVFVESFVPESIAIVCQLKISALAIGFSLVFGVLFSKTWRVYLIFTNGAKQGKTVKDTQLFAMVGFLVMINITILTVWFVVDPIQCVIHNLPTKTDMEADTELHISVEHCESPRQLYFTASLFTVQGILLLFGVFLAFQTRTVKVDSLNDSRMIGICIYNVLVLSLLGIMVFFTLKSDVNLNYGITTLITILGTSATQCIIFLPKMHRIWNKVSDQQNTNNDRTDNKSTAVIS